MPSGLHDGDSSGSGERTTVCGLKPSESATISAYCAPLPGAGGGDVGDAGEERAAHAEDLLVDGIGDLVGDVAHGVAARGQRKAEQALLLGDVEQFVFDPVAAAAGIEHATDDQVILVERAPGRVVDLAAAGRAFDDVLRRQAAELAGAVEIGGDDLGDVGFRRGARALVRHRHDRDRQRRGIAADDVDFQPLLLRGSGEGQQHGKQRGEPGQGSFHRQGRPGEVESELNILNSWYVNTCSS